MPSRPRTSTRDAHPRSDDSYAPSARGLNLGYSSDIPTSDGPPYDTAPRSSPPQWTKHAAVERVLRTMDRVGLSTATFLHALFYGDQACISDNSLSKRRRHFYAHPLMPTVLTNMCQPPHRAATRRGHRFKGPARFSDNFAYNTLVKKLEKELASYEGHLPVGSLPLDKEALLSTNIDDLLADFQKYTPTLVRIIQRMMASKASARRTGTGHIAHSRNMISVIGSMLIFSRSNRQNQLQRKLSLYFKAKGTPTAVFDFLQSIGLTLSYRWALDAVDSLASSEMVAMRIWVANEAFAVDMDNVLLRYGVASQRVDNRTQTINATAGTVIMLPRHVLTTLRSYGEAVQSLRVRMRHARSSDPTSMPRLSVDDLIDPAAQKRFAEQHIFYILRALLDCSKFQDFSKRNDPVFAPPPPVRQLPTGPAHRTKYFMLQTEPYDETSYDGILECITAFMKQMGLDTPEAQLQYAIERGIPWGGDGLTTARMRHLQRFRVDAANGWDRLDWFFNFGCLFHQAWWIAIDIHHNHYGTDVGDGLGRKILALGRTGMAQSTKKPDFHTLDEMITQFWTASTLDCWLWVSGSSSLSELRAWADTQTSSQLHLASERIYRERQSTQAIRAFDNRRRRNPRDFDERVYHRTVADRDMGFYVTLRRSIKQGDIGIYRDALPDLLTFYKGGGNSNYVKETAEFMQFLKEMPSDVRDLVLDHCLLVNVSGQPNRFIPTGQLQEHNNDKVKNNHSTHAAGSSFELTRRMSPALPVLDGICKHVDSSFTDLYHGVSHTAPNAEFDIVKMTMRFFDSGVHVWTPGRKVDRVKDSPVDQMRKGTQELVAGTWLDEWWETREVFLRYAKTTQNFSEAPV